METLIESNPELTGAFLAFLSMLLVGLFSKNLYELYKIGKAADTAKKDRENLIKIKTKNKISKESLIKLQKKREAQIKSAVELSSIKEKEASDEMIDPLASEWNKKFGKDE